VIGYWLVIAIAALAVVAVLIAILVDDEDTANRAKASIASIALFGASRLPDGSDWVAALRNQPGAPVEILDRTTGAVDLADLAWLDLAHDAAISFDAAIVALPSAAPGTDHDLGTWEQALATALFELHAHRIEVVVLIPAIARETATEAVPDSAPASRWHATVARLTSAAGAMLLIVGDSPDEGERADDVAASARAWFLHGPVAEDDAH